MRAKCVNEDLDFERGQDPKRSLKIGVDYIIPEITSDNLELLGDVLDSENEIVAYKNWYESHGEDYGDYIEAEETYKRLYQIALALKDKIQWGEFFDHHQEDDLDEYLQNPPKGMKYAYNAYPDSDGWDVVWSSIPLPSAEEIEE